MLETRQGSELRRDRARQRITLESQVPEVGQGRQGRGDRSRQPIAPERQTLESSQGTQCRRDRPRQVVEGEIQHLEVGQVPQPVGDRSGQPTVIQPQLLDVGQGPQCRRYRPRQVCIEGEIQSFEVGQGPQCRRDWPGQPVEPEIQIRDAAALVRGDPVPLSERPAASPVRVLTPVGAVGRVVDRHEGLTVGLGRNVAGCEQDEHEPENPHGVGQPWGDRRRATDVTGC